MQTATPLAELSASFDDDYEESSYASVPLLGCLFIEGILKVDCIILRCVGFNHEIYNTLSARFDVVKPLQERLNGWMEEVDREGYRAAVKEFYEEMEARRAAEAPNIVGKIDRTRRAWKPNNLGKGKSWAC